MQLNIMQDPGLDTGTKKSISGKTGKIEISSI